jgi:hypothetical protein
MTPGPGFKDFFTKRWVQNGLLVLATAAAAYAMIYVDVLARAREAFRQGETYSRWNENPDEKKQALEKKFIENKEALDKKKSRRKITEQEYQEKLDVYAFERDQQAAESSVKYAYQWYKDAYELFSPPESRWARRARYLAPAAKQKWREELMAKQIPFEEYMLDLEAGENDKTLMVYSTQSTEEALKAVEALKTRGVEATQYDAKANGRLAQEGIKIIVPKESFWLAHDTLADFAPAP